MAYNITHTDGTSYTHLGEGMLDQTLGISLIGQNFHNYGQFIANNFLQLLENQANVVPPANPVEGQLWWDSKNKVMQYFDGNRFKTCSTTALTDSPPLRPQNGDQWWDTVTGQLKIMHNGNWIVIGPLNPLGEHFSGIAPIVVTDTNGRQHYISTLNVDGEVIGLINKDELFTLPAPISGITAVGTGITLAPTSTLTGNVLNSFQLGGTPASAYVRTTDVSTTLAGSLNVAHINGLTVGGMADPLRLVGNNTGHSIRSSATNITVGVWSTGITVNGVDNNVSVSVEPSTPSSIATRNYVDVTNTATRANVKAYIDSKVTTLSGNAILDSMEALSNAVNNDAQFHVNISAALNFKANIASPVFTGEPKAPTVNTADNSTKIATTAYVRNAIASGVTNVGTLDGLTMGGNILPSETDIFDIGSPTLRFRNIYGTAMRANYADLAENYKSDEMYIPGTVVVFGGDYEITVSYYSRDARVAGIVSTDPAYLMNSNDDDTYLPVALTGKVPCLVTGPIRKGDLLMSSSVRGVATKMTADKWVPGCVIGKSLENSDDENVRLVTVAVGRF